MARKISMLGIPDGRDRDRLEQGHLQHADHQGHLRPRDFRDLVQDDDDAPVRPRTSIRSSPTASPIPTTSRASQPRSRARPARSSCAGIDPFGAFDRAAAWPQRAGGKRMYGRFEQHLEDELAGDPRSRLLQDRAGDHDAAGQPCRGRLRRRPDQSVRQQLSRPRPEPARSKRRRARGARALGLRHGLGPLHLRHPERPQAARGPALGLAPDRGHDPLSLLLRRQWRAVTRPCSGRGRGHLRRAQPCLDHRRRPPLQGAALPLPQCRHGRSRGAAEGRRRRRRALQADRHRRRLLDGRL